MLGTHIVGTLVGEGASQGCPTLYPRSHGRRRWSGLGLVQPTPHPASLRLPVLSLGTWLSCFKQHCICFLGNIIGKKKITAASY